MVDNVPMSDAAERAFWTRTLRVSGALLLVWLLVSVLVPWFARDLHGLQAFGFPLGYWLASQGALLMFLLIIVAYVVVMDRLDARHLAQTADATSEGQTTDVK